MAGAVLNRTCYFLRVGGTIRPQEWCTINVEGFGPMVEQFWPFETNVISLDQGTKVNDDFSTANDFGRVDEFVEVTEEGLLKALNGGDTKAWSIGGRNYPRSGR
jgi:hypothetical protein